MGERVRLRPELLSYEVSAYHGNDLRRVPPRSQGRFSIGTGVIDPAGVKPKIRE